MTLSISVTKKTERKDLRTVKGYVGISSFLLLFGIIYEQFSHEVYSWYMMGAFLIPLAGGAFPAFLFNRNGLLLNKRHYVPEMQNCAGMNHVANDQTRRENKPGHTSSLIGEKTVYRCGLATLTVGSIMKGILDIYGTTNRLINLYWIVGGILLVTGAVIIIWKNKRK